jgi:hypothetical protein
MVTDRPQPYDALFKKELGNLDFSRRFFREILPQKFTAGPALGTPGTGA